jgi:hypothetical protein
VPAQLAHCGSSCYSYPSRVALFAGFFFVGHVFAQCTRASKMRSRPPLVLDMSTICHQAGSTFASHPNSQQELRQDRYNRDNQACILGSLRIFLPLASVDFGCLWPCMRFLSC